MTRGDGPVRSGPGPSEYALAYAVRGFAVALRCGAVAVVVVAALVDDADDGVSRLWQPVVLGGLVLWAVFFAVAATRYGLGLPLLIGDSAVVALVMLLQPWVVPVSSVIDETTWAIMLAGTAVFVALLSAGQVTGMLLGAAVIAAYVVGVPAETSQVRTLIVQVTALSVIMWLLRRGGRRADVIVAVRDRERRRAMLAAARRSDERLHRFQVHDSVLSTLSMVASGAVPTDSPALRRDARRALEVMEKFSGGWVDAPAEPVDLVEHLLDLTAHLSVPVAVDLVAVPGGAGLEVPAPVAAAITGGVGEALRNVDRHAGVSRARVRAERHDGDGSVTVTVSDEGRGFAPGDVQDGRLGIRHSIVERMTTVGGRATVTSRPGAGTEITLRWPHG